MSSSLDALDEEENNPLCAACAEGRIDVAQELLVAGEDPNALGGLGSAPLFIACEQENPQLVSLLLSARAEPDMPAYGGATPLFIAATRNQPAIAQLLIDAGAQIDAVGDNDYYTPLLACTKRTVSYTHLTLPTICSV